MAPKEGKSTSPFAAQPGLPANFVEVLEAMPDAILGVDQEGVIRFVNRLTETLFGYERAALIGQPVETLVPESLRQVHLEHRQGYAEELETRAPGTSLEVSGQHRDGTAFPVDIALSRVNTDGGLLVIAAVREIGRAHV